MPRRRRSPSRRRCTRRAALGNTSGQTVYRTSAVTVSNKYTDEPPVTRPMTPLR